MGAVHEPPLEGSAAQGREIVYWLANACKGLREEAGVRTATIAHYSGEGAHTVERFERVERFPEHLDPIVAAYARVAGFTDDRDVYLEAIDLWIEQGEPHLIQQDGRADERVTAAVVSARKRDAARKRRQARRGRGEAPKTSTTKRRAAG